AITTAGALDFENNPNYTLTISVSDGELSATADITVKVTDVDEATEPENTAPAIADQTFSVAEDAPSGATVGTVQASDAETNNLMFSITAGNTGNAFAIGEGTGAITTAGALDFENTMSYTLTISVSDGNLSATADVTINVTDVDETAATRQAIANDIETLKGKQDGHLQTTNIADAQMKLAALQNESPATAATYKAAVDAITAVTALDDATLTALQGEITAIEGRITALEMAGNAPAGTLQPLKDGLAARKMAQTNLSKSASELTTELRKITVSEETKTMALQTELGKSSSDWDAILMLIAEGADVNAKSNTGNTALIVAARNGQTVTVNALLKVSGINVNIQNNFNNTALIVAARNGYTAIVNALLAVPGIHVNVIGSNRRTALHFATLNGGHKAIVEALLEVSDIKVNAIDVIDKTPLDLANFLSDSDDKTAIIEALRAKGAETKAELDSE
ncbi:MAG: cadherin domain-containing protein, partial [Ekhidna sp.]|nr:cadherin domain-containing protein [Ekhidna sp.]